MRLGITLPYAGGLAESVSLLEDYRKAGVSIVFVPEAYTFDSVSQLGYIAAKVKRVLPHLKKLKTDESPFIGPNAPRRAAGIHWVNPELVAEVEFAGWTPDGMVRQAAFKDLRLDKPASEVKAEKPVDPEEAEMPAPKAKARTTTKTAVRKSTGKPEVLGIAISNPDKAMWPDAGDGEPVTKLDLARYYEEVGDWMLPHIKGIPCSVVRAPDGFDKEQ